MKRFIFKMLDCIGAGGIYFATGLLVIFAAIGDVAVVLLSVVMDCAVPAFCIVAAWGILKYFGVL